VIGGIARSGCDQLSLHFERDVRFEEPLRKRARICRSGISVFSCGDNRINDRAKRLSLLRARRNNNANSISRHVCRARASDRQFRFRGCRLRKTEQTTSHVRRIFLQRRQREKEQRDRTLNLYRRRQRAFMFSLRINSTMENINHPFAPNNGCLCSRMKEWMG